jgi:hypothetical protein
MVIVAKAKLYTASTNDLKKLALAIRNNQKKTGNAKEKITINDPLRKWFSPIRLAPQVFLPWSICFLCKLSDKL